MNYALLIYSDQESWAGLSDDEKAKLRAAQMPHWASLFEELQKADSSVSGYELDEAGTAKVVRVRDGERIVTDGPFAETKEVLGGAFVLEVSDLDEAIRLAALVPTAWRGSLEIRPILQ
jgi:hypothetical protein